MNTAADLGFVLFAHGSRAPEANASCRLVAVHLANDLGTTLVETAFLELADPDLPTAVQNLVAQGSQRIVIVPYFLTLGIHLQRDLPEIITQLSEQHPGVEFTVTPPLDGHPALAAAVRDRAQSALAALATS